MPEPLSGCPEVLRAASRLGWCHWRRLGPVCDRRLKPNQPRSPETRHRQSRPSGYSYPPAVRRPYFDKTDHFDHDSLSSVSRSLLTECTTAGMTVSNRHEDKILPAPIIAISYGMQPRGCRLVTKLICRREVLTARYSWRWRCNASAGRSGPTA
jgi:hypothetical protein